MPIASPISTHLMPISLDNAEKDHCDAFISKFDPVAPVETGPREPPKTVLIERDFTPVLERARGDVHFCRTDEDVHGRRGITQRLRQTPRGGQVKSKRQMAVTRANGVRIHEDFAVGVKSLRTVPHFRHAVRQENLQAVSVAPAGPERAVATVLYNQDLFNPLFRRVDDDVVRDNGESGVRAGGFVDGDFIGAVR